MKKYALALLFLFMVSLSACETVDDTDDNNGEGPLGECGNPEIGDYEITWCDEFTGEGDNVNAQGVDMDKWDFQTGTGEEYGLTGWGNNEAQYYREENARVEDGRLIIEALHENHEGMDYTSARLWTKPTFDQTYGRFEAKIKLPVGDGLWPAFWMLPQDDVYGGWAASGEIDIMEAKGRLPMQSTGAIHYGGSWPDNTYEHGEYAFPEDRSIADFNVYAIEWEEEEIRWYVNDEHMHTASSWYTEGHDFPAPFDQDFYLLLNLAVGGNFDDGRMPPDSLFDDPVQMEVEYVRVYQKDSDD
ncbi:MAG: glycoside hydrolase family 16 protein [Bacillota bacterium]